MQRLVDKKINPRFLNLPQLSELFQVPHQDKQDSVAENFVDNLQQLPNFEYKIELIIENQRGLKFFGIPLFSNNSLLPIVDPSSFQLLNGENLKLIDNKLDNLPLPDLNWQWDWNDWYVLMLDDVDDQGWIYSKIFFNSHHWKGKYYFGNFIRRRVWMRLRRRQAQN